jgi:hypothetical protein
MTSCGLGTDAVAASKFGASDLALTDVNESVQERVPAPSSAHNAVRAWKSRMRGVSSELSWHVTSQSR